MSRSTQRDIFVDVADRTIRCALRWAMTLAEAAARLHDVGRQPVHLDIALVADDEPLRRIEQQQALRHVVDGGVEPLLFQRQPLLRQSVLLRQLANDEKQHERRWRARRARPRRSEC